MAVQLKLCWCLLFAFAIICSARNTISVSGDEIVTLGLQERSLKMELNDYDDASANRGHDPKNRGGWGNGGRRGGRDNP